MFAFVLTLIALSSLQCAFADRMTQLNVGITAGSSDVVFQGQLNLVGINPWKPAVSAKDTPGHGYKFYISLAAGPVDSVSVQLDWPGAVIGSTNQYVAKTYTSWPGAWNAPINITQGDQTTFQYFELSPPTGNAAQDVMAPLTFTGCSSETDRTVSSKLTLKVAGYDDIDLSFTKDCTFPEIGFGSSNATTLTIFDILTPARTSTTPKLRPNADQIIYLTPNNPSRSIVMAMEIKPNHWEQYAQANYWIEDSVSTTDGIAVSVADDSTRSGMLAADYPDARGTPNVLNLLFTATCTGAANANRDSGLVTVRVYAGFSHPYVLDIFNVTCGDEGRLNPLTSLQVTLASTPQLDSGFYGAKVVTDGVVQQLWTSSGHLVYLLEQQQTIGFNFAWATADPSAVYSSRIQVRSLGGSGASGGSVVRLYNYRDNVDIKQSAIYTWPAVNFFPLYIDTTCFTNGTVSVWEVLLTDVKRTIGANVQSYNTLQFRFTWNCVIPVFALSTSSLIPLEVDLVSSSKPLLGQPAPNRQVTTKPALHQVDTVITTQMSHEVTNDVIYFYQQDGPINNRSFTWSIDPTTVNDLKDADITLKGQRLDQANAAREYTYEFDVSRVGQRESFEVTSFTCKARGSVRLVTWLRYGFQEKIQLIWERACTAPDTFDVGGASLDDGAIFGIVVAVLFVVGCLGGVAYNSVKLGKSGLSVIPGYDSFSAWNDGVQGPKRYSSEISSTGSKSKVADVEIHSLGYGSYQQSDDGYVDEIDTL